MKGDALTGDLFKLTAALSETSSSPLIFQISALPE